MMNMPGAAAPGKLSYGRNETKRHSVQLPTLQSTRTSHGRHDLELLCELFADIFSNQQQHLRRMNAAFSL